MITFHYLGYRGRLGNQMFQYATLFSIAKRNNYSYGIPYKNKNNSDEYQKLNLLDCFENISAQDCQSILPKKQIQEIDNNFNSAFLNIEDDLDLFGYFQSEKYFKKYKTEILHEFTFKKDIKEKILKLKKQIKNPIASVHMRFGDYELFPNVYPRCTQDYYYNALSLFPKNIDIILFSDNLEKASSLMEKTKKRFYIFPGLSNFEDLYFMSLCDYHVIANSSFSWWGAWLSNSKKTVAPKTWYGLDPNAPKSWNDIYCEGWEII